MGSHIVGRFVTSQLSGFCMNGLVVNDERHLMRCFPYAYVLAHMTLTSAVLGFLE